MIEASMEELRDTYKERQQFLACRTAEYDKMAEVVQEKGAILQDLGISAFIDILNHTESFECRRETH